MKKEIFIIILAVISIGMIGFNRKKIDYSNQYVKVLEDTTIYIQKEDTFEEVGTIYKGTTLQLKEKLKNYYAFGNYYIKTDQLEITDSVKDDTYKRYIPFNEIIKTSSPTIFYKENKAYELNESFSFRVILKDSHYYYVLFQEELFKIKQENVSSMEEDHEYESAEIISVLDFKENSFKEHMEILKNYFQMNLEEYQRWLNQEINLPKESVLVLGSSEGMNQSLDFNGNNEATTRENPNNSYIVTSNLDEFKKMLNHEKIYDMSIIATSIPVLNYHFFTDGTLNCNEIICLDINKFRSHLQYFKENNYKVLRISEFIDWVYGRIELPEKSVLITIDDGACGTGFLNGNLLIPVLEEYKMPATLFLVTAWWDPANYKSDYLEVESHSYDLHKIGACGNQNIDCLNGEELYQDLLKSTEILGSNKAFAYPFYNHNLLAEQALKKVGFEVAFIGGDRNATREDNKYMLPRYPIYSTVTLDQIKEMVN